MMSMTTSHLPHEPVLQAAETVLLPETDGVPLENPWHRKNINLLCESLQQHWKDRRDYFVGGNMCVYYSVKQARNRDFLGPDVFVVQGVDFDKPRQVWATWEEENRGLDVAIELLSPSTATHDLTDKKDIYEQTLRTPEYFCFDQETRTLWGWRLDARRHYQRIEPAADGRLWSEELDLWLGAWDGEFDNFHATWLRWFNATGNLCLAPTEDATDQVVAATERANAEGERANAEGERANAEAERANQAESELHRLKELLASHGISPPS